jgi:AraC-like DNA-binding protein
MLTAKADAESRLQGIERGADAYLPKPFQPDELYVHIRKLLELRQKLQLYYRSQTDLEPEEKADIPASEDIFVQNVRAVVLRNLGDEHFSVEQFCRELHMSHSHLHRKLIALTGLSATRFIRHVRLNAAREMFKDARLTITAIAFDTGFSDPSYFGRIFKKEFGMTPAEWREKVLKP